YLPSQARVTRYFSLSSSMQPAAAVILSLSLHDALPISSWRCVLRSSLRFLQAHASLAVKRCLLIEQSDGVAADRSAKIGGYLRRDRKSTRLNSSHVKISYAVFCLKKKNTSKTS